MAVAHEVDLTDPHQIHRRERLSAPHRRSDVLPAGAHPARGRPEAAVEVAFAVDGSDDRIQRDHLHPGGTLRDEPQRGDDLLVGEDHAHVAGFAAQPGRDP